MQNRTLTELVIVGALLGGFVLLLAGTIGIVVLNRSKEAFALLGSVVLVAVALATLLFSSRRSSLDSAFTTSVVLDTVDGAPPVMIPNASNFRGTRRFNDLYFFTHPLARGTGGALWQQGETVSVPGGYDQNRASAFCGDLLQYQVLSTTHKLQAGGRMVGLVGGTSISEVYTPFHLSKIQKYRGKEILPAIAVNRFANNDGQRAIWEASSLPLPPDTALQLIHQSAAETDGPERYITRFEKPLFFCIDFIAEPLGAPSRGVLPSGLNLSQPIAGRCQTFEFSVRMRASFQWITAGSWQTREYKEWANWLFAKLKEDLGNPSG